MPWPLSSDFLVRGSAVRALADLEAILAPTLKSLDSNLGVLNLLDSKLRSSGSEFGGLGVILIPSWRGFLASSRRGLVPILATNYEGLGSELGRPGAILARTWGISGLFSDELVLQGVELGEH